MYSYPVTICEAAVNLAERLAELNGRLFERTVQVLLGCPLGCGASEHLTQVLHSSLSIYLPSRGDAILERESGLIVTFDNNLQKAGSEYLVPSHFRPDAPDQWIYRFFLSVNSHCFCRPP